ncbi:hypothetical protein HDC95_000434 [Microbacterium sp. AK031]|nr:hypothetical protein [Microbacterium sp. AK031]
MVHRFYRVTGHRIVDFAVSWRALYQLTGSALPSSYPAAD